jgi:hypothetical protein
MLATVSSLCVSSCCCALATDSGGDEGAARQIRASDVLLRIHLGGAISVLSCDGGSISGSGSDDSSSAAVRSRRRCMDRK